MRLVKLAFISALVLFGIMVIISLLLPSHLRISRAIDINAPQEKIYPLVAETRQWGRWNEYFRSFHHAVAESGMLKTDEMAIFIDSSGKNLITTSWHPPSGNHFGSGFAFIGTDSHHAFVTVQWYFDFNIKWYPWQKIQSIVYDQQMGPVMEKSLANLKQIAENSP